MEIAFGSVFQPQAKTTPFPASPGRAGEHWHGRSGCCGALLLVSLAGSRHVTRRRRCDWRVLIGKRGRASHGERSRQLLASQGSSVLSILTEASEDFEAEDFEDDFMDDLQRSVEESREQHQRAVSVGRAAGHEPVLLLPVLQALFPPSCLANAEDEVGIRLGKGVYNGLYVDCTFGRGGYSREILSRLSEDGRLLALDIDSNCLGAGRLLENEDERFCFLPRAFSDLVSIFESPEENEEVSRILELGPPSGIVFDVGVCSVQMDNRARGFSLQNLQQRPDSPLDLRMNQSVGKSAAEWLQAATVEELAWVLREYGATNQEPVQAERMAQVIYDDLQENGPIESMNRLAEIVGRARCIGDESFEHPPSGRAHPARLTVQAIRLFLNSELEQLRVGLESAFRVLAYGGRCVVTVFKQPEEAIVRRFLVNMEDPDPETVARYPKRRLVELFPLAGSDSEFAVRLQSLPVRPAVGEVSMNIRARSGVVFVMEKVPRTCPRVKAKPRKLVNRFKEPERNPII